jgi:hypothetical protein
VTLNTLNEVGRQHRIPLALVHLAEHAVARDAGVVDQHVDRPDFGLDALLDHRAAQDVVVGHVAFGGVELETFGLVLAPATRPSAENRAGSWPPL